MSKVSRRSVLAGLSSIPFAVWFERYGSAQQTFVRRNVLTTQGRAMLQIYAGAVRRMKNTSVTPEGDPRSWLFQWYTHSVRSDRTKAGEIARVYPTPSARRDLAQEMWNTCQAHRAGTRQDFFLPWHRMYVYFFERIIRQVSGNNTFALPYWNYSDPRPGVHGVLPREFRLPRDPVFSPLFVQERNAAANNGTAIDAGQPGNPLGTQMLAQCTYKRVSPAIPGFCAGVDTTPHGWVHGLTGGPQNMGAVPWAAKDPIFWLHHCNIDRLWASWNRAGRQNPTDDASFTGQQFVFADEQGRRVVATVRDVLDFSRMGYTYDAFEPLPPNTCGTRDFRAAPLVHAAAPSGAVELGPRPVRVTLEARQATRGPEGALSSRARALPPGRRIYLVVGDLRADLPPNTTYDIHLELPARGRRRAARSFYVGSIHFFDSVAHEGHDGGHDAAAAPNPEKNFSFDVTALVQRLSARGQLPAEPTFTIRPHGRPNADARPVVGNLSVIEH